MVRHRAACLALSLSIVVSAPMSSQAPRTPPGNDFVMRNFRFADGETLPELRIHYITLGTLRKDANGGATNAVLILHGTTGAGTQFLSPSFAGVLYGPGQTLD